MAVMKKNKNKYECHKNKSYLKVTRSGKSGFFLCYLDSFYTNLYLSSDIHIVVVNIKLD